MKQNLIIVLLTVMVTLLLVNLYEGRYPPTAKAEEQRSRYSIESIIEDCSVDVSGGYVQGGYVYGSSGSISC